MSPDPTKQFKSDQPKSLYYQSKEVEQEKPLMRSMIEIPINQPATNKQKSSYLFGTSPPVTDENHKMKPVHKIQFKSSPNIDVATTNQIEIPDPDYSPIVVRRSEKLWGNAARYKGSLEDHLDQPRSQKGPKVREMVTKIKQEAERDRIRQRVRLTRLDNHNNSRMSSSRSSEDFWSKDSDEAVDDTADEIYKELLTVVEREKRHFYGNPSPKVKKGKPTKNARINNYSRPSSRGPDLYHPEQPIYRHPNPYGGETSSMYSSAASSRMTRNPYDDVVNKQSHFFNSLFPSRANRFGFPVYPQRQFGIPSPEGSGPVSFAGFSPDLNPSFYEPDIDAQEMATSSSISGATQPTSILSAVPRLLKPKKKKESSKRSFFSFFY